MKLLNRLRELRNDELLNEHFSDPEDQETETNSYQHPETIGIGATTVYDLMRLNFEQDSYSDNFRFK